MKLFLYDMGTYTQRDIMETLTQMGISYKNIVYKLRNVHEDIYFQKRIKELLEADAYDAVFSVNYYPVLARICHVFGIPYLSWSYDSPLNIEHIEETLGYETNFVFFFDRAECEKYWKKGYGNVYHLPLAVNTKRLEQVRLSKEEQKKYSGDISMLGQLYDTSLPVLMAPLGDYEKGYLTAVMESQLRLYGCYFLEEVITEELLEAMNNAYAAMGQDKLKLTKDGLIVALAKHITHIERVLLLDVLSETYQVHLYGPETDETLSNVIWHGSAGYFDEMPKVFKASKVNLNVSLKCIQSGIPLRVLDILGCGGFLLSNYQPEIAEQFIDGKEVVMYTSLEDAVEKCKYYLEHDEERRRIAQNGCQKVKELFGYEDRLSAMLRTAGLL
ncbi:MAG: DUF3880 domain-containing protein [Roseburia sp.]|nr:DUF3880 domain-containing protein [Roseburia sp.]MCM1278439.1 DUF3880 domain-containing protein [Robinsoniella sp.]